MKKYRPTSSGFRGRSDLDRADLTRTHPEKSLTVYLSRRGGRNNTGKVTVRHQGGGAKRLYRLIDFKRDKKDIPARVVSIEYDPNRGSHIALLFYADGEKRYILAPVGLGVGQSVIRSETAALTVGNALSVGKLPVGTFIHNLEISPNRGGQIARGAGNYAIIAANDGSNYVQIKMPSGEIRRFLSACLATIGQLSNPEKKNVKLGKAGRSRHLGIRPTVRGVAQHPASHPHGGGEGRSGIGMSTPKTPWGKRAMGVKTRHRPQTDQYLLKRR